MYKAVLGAICCLSFALSLHAQSPQEKGLQSISRTSAKAIVGFLADDELQGREAGMHGSRLAARYLASCLKKPALPRWKRTIITNPSRLTTRNANNGDGGKCIPTPSPSLNKASTASCR
jgi:hypothetical protein